MIGRKALILYFFNK